MALGPIGLGAWDVFKTQKWIGLNQAVSEHRDDSTVLAMQKVEGRVASAAMGLVAPFVAPVRLRQARARRNPHEC